jgi:glycosyltransferase involved in cell wall biosynthesis
MKTWLIDARTFASRPTGVGTYAFRLLGQLRREEPASRFVLACDVEESDMIRACAAQGLDVRAYGRRVFNSVGVLGYFQFVKRVVADVRPDVFWQPNNLQPFRPKGVPRVIVTMHDVFGLDSFSLRYAPWHIYYRLAFGRTLRNATELWFNSRETERQVRAAASRRLDSLDTRITYPIADVPLRASIAPAHRERPYFLYLGNIEKRKGADILIEAYARYQARGGTSDLVFAGIEKNVVVPRTEGIDVLGYVPDAMKFSLLCSAQALVVPSRAEGYGMQVAEAAALGVPCLASDLAVFREIDSTGRRVFPTGDSSALSAAMLSFSEPCESCEKTPSAWA